MSGNELDMPASEASQSASAAPPPTDAQQQRRRETLRRVGQVSLNPGPLLAVMRASAHEPDEVAEAIRQCPTLTARVLCVTNAAAQRPRHEIENVSRAVIHLGAARARAVAMAFGLRIVTDGMSLSAHMRQRLWLSSLRKAHAARFASHLIEPRHAEQAYGGALIQDIGLPLLVAMDPAFYCEQLIPGAHGDWSQQELQRFGLDHAELGQRLLASWEASDGLTHAVRHHHQPPPSQGSWPLSSQVPLFLASLLPHLDEEMTGTEREWLTSLHGQFLTDVYPGPDAFLRAANDAASTIVRGQPEPEPMELYHDLARQVGGDTIVMITQLCRLEEALGRQRAGLDELRFQAFTDPLTKLLNRRGFIHLAERRAEDAAARRLGACCLVIDLDELKPVNDRYGHSAGDHMLRGLGKVLRRKLDRNDLIGRIGGDEFAVFLTGIDRARALEIIERLVGAAGTRLRLADGVEIKLRFSIGAVYVPAMRDMIEIDELIAAADDAMYHRKRVKEKGGAQFVDYEVDDDADSDPPALGG